MLRLTSTLLLFVAVCFAQQQPQPPAQEPASLSGKVSNVVGGQPVRKVNLILRPMGHRAESESRKPYGTVSDSDGKFVFEAVEPGPYTLSAERAGFVRQSYGAKHSRSDGNFINLLPGRSLTELDFQLTPQAVLSGKVVDEEGDPVGRVQVRIAQIGYRKGKRQPVTQQGAMTDEEGEFRISNLSPGHYYLCAGAPIRMMGLQGTRSAARDAAKTNLPREDFAGTCYPSATEAASAAPIEVAAGQNVSGLDIRLHKSRVVRVTGQLSGTIPGLPYDQIQISLRAPDPSSIGAMMFNPSTTIDQKGYFEIASVHPGSYRLVAMSIRGMVQGLSSQPLEVGNEDVVDVVLRLTPQADVKGKVILEGDPPKSPASMQIMLRPAETGFGSAPTPVADDGSFLLTGVAATKYTLNVFPLPDGAYLRTVHLGDQEMPPHALDFSSGIAGDLEVYVKMSAGRLEGVVNDDNNQPAAGATVTLAPDPPNPELEQLYSRTGADQNGSFQFRNIAPGNYRLYAWEDLEPGAEYDSEPLKSLSRLSERVAIEENGHAKITLVRISVAALEEARAKPAR